MTDDQKPDREAMETAQYLTGALQAVAAEVKELRSYGRRNRKWIVFDIVITVLLTAVGFIAFHAIQSAHDANVSAQAARAVAAVATQNNRNLCESSNIARAQQIDLWNYAIGLNKGVPQTAQQKEKTARFEVHLHSLYAPRDCANVNPGKP